MSQGKQLLLAAVLCTVVLAPMLVIWSKRPDPPPRQLDLYGMSVDQCISRWGKPADIINPKGPATALVYDASGVRVILGAHGRVVRFDDAAGNRLNSYHADEKLRGLR